MSTGEQNSTPRRTAPEVFIGYRRHTDEGYAHLLSRDLIKEFGGDAVFRDVERLGGGDKFLPKIRAALEACNTFLALISPGWLKEAGRLHDPEDFVRMEIAAALASDVTVIPVLLNGAQMPKKGDLPADIRELTSRHYEELRDSRWDDDVRHLIEVIRQARPRSSPGRLSGAARSLFGTWRGRGALAALLLLSSAAFYFTVNRGPRDFEGCVRSHFPDVPRDRFRTAEDGSYNFPAIRQDQPKEGAFVVSLTDGGRPVGALSITLYPANDLFKVGAVVEPPCREVETYLNDDNKGADKHNLHNWDRLRLTLAGRDYILRPGHQENTIFVTFNEVPSPPSP